MFNDMMALGSGGSGVNNTPILIPANEMSTSSYKEIELGFAPKHVVICFNTDSFLMVWLDVDNNTLKASYTGTWETDVTSSWSTYFYVSGTKLYMKAASSTWLVKYRVFAL